jgi:putative tryptophan/tyrosine transport system substrate-binding protein
MWRAVLTASGPDGMMPPREEPPMERRGSRVSRRAFVVGAGSLGLLVGCGRLPWQAHPPAKVYRIGVLTPGSGPYAVDPWRQELRESGWVEGENVLIEDRWADGQLERLPELAAELVQLPVDVIMTTGGTAAIRAAQAATSTIPIVFDSAGDPVGAGVVASLAHPGGNTTGLSNMAPQLTQKRVQLLTEAVPEATHLAAIWAAADPNMAREYGESLIAAQALGVEMQPLTVRTADDLDGAYAAATSGRVDAVVVIANPLIFSNRTRLVELSTRSRLPTISGDYTFAAAGGLMSYGPNFIKQTQRAAHFIDKILKGAKPADLPVEQPMTFEFVVNLKTAQALGLTFPNEIMLQVTEVLQ